MMTIFFYFLKLHSEKLTVGYCMVSNVVKCNQQNSYQDETETQMCPSGLYQLFCANSKDKFLVSWPGPLQTSRKNFVKQV